MTDPASDSVAPDNPAIRSSNPSSSRPPIPPGSTTGVRSIGIMRCPACGAVGHTHDAVCTACGEELRRTPRLIKCRHCAQQASSELVVCPGCGRELREAPPRLLTWGAPVLMVALFFVVLSSQWDRVNPFSLARNHFSSGIALVGDISGRIEPEIVIMMTPIAGDAAPVESTGDLAASDGASDRDHSGEADILETNVAVVDVSSVAMAAITPTLNSEPADAQALAAALAEPVPDAPDAGATPTAPLASLGVGGARFGDDPEATATTPPTLVPPTTAPVEAVAIEPTATSEAAASTTQQALAPTATWTPIASTPPAQGLAATLGGTQSDAAESEPDQAASAAALTTEQNTDQDAEQSADQADQNGEAAIASVAQVAGVQAPAAPSASSVPSPAPTATPDATPTPVVYQIETGDTLVRIATRFGVTVDALMEANNISARQVGSLQPGRLLIIPLPATDADGDTDAGADTVDVPTPNAQYYQVRSGDTLMSIAAQQGVTVEALMAANNLSERDVASLQPGRLLTIPTPTPSEAEGSEAATPTAAPMATATQTPAPLAATAAPEATTEVALRLDAPVLLNPQDGAELRCNQPNSLRWQSVRQMRDTDKFLVHLGFVSGSASDGSEQITWVLAQPRPATMTSWELDASLCSLAPQAHGRQWRWRVEVVEEVEGALHPVSLPSVERRFSWN